jgi:broad specificity phosphatase PhoE
VVENFYIYRHGDTQATSEHRPYILDFYHAHILKEVSPRIEHLSVLIRNVDFAVHFSSPFIRCRETSSLITKTIGVKQALFDWRLSEHTIVEPKFILNLRVENFIQFCNTKFNGNILICTHQEVAREIVKRVTKLSDSVSNLEFNPLSLTVFNNHGLVDVFDQGFI